MNESLLRAITALGLLASTIAITGCASRSPATDSPGASEAAQRQSGNPTQPTEMNAGERPPLGGTNAEKVAEPTAASAEDTIATNSSPAGDAPAPLRRWAIISSESIRTSGFPDLLTTVLGDVEGIELVERDQLDLVLAELELSELQSPGGGEDRQRLGVLAGAQRLLLLDGKDWNGSGDVGVQVIDTYSGVNLFRGQVKLEKDSADAAAERMATLARDLEQKYADGIRAVVGIPYFLSKTANKGNASLQEEFPNLLASAVRNLPGVAVLAVKEAQLIQNEMVLSGHSIRRFLPLFVSGEYEIYARQADNDQRLRLSVTVSDGSEVEKKIEKDRITLPEARELLTSEAAELILELLSRKDLLPLTREQQEAALDRKADELAAAGEILRAIELREAALLLSPNNPRHRIKIILDRDGGGVEYQDVEAVFPHLEYLFRNRRVSVSRGYGLVRLVNQWIWNHFLQRGARLPSAVSDESPVSRYNDARTFLFAMFPWLLQLPPPEGRSESAVNLDFVGAPLTVAAQRREYGAPTALILSELLRNIRAYRDSFPEDFSVLVQKMPQDVLPFFREGSARAYLQVLTREELWKASAATRNGGTERDVFVADYFGFLIGVEDGWAALTEDVYHKLADLEEALQKLKERKTDRVPPCVAESYEKQFASLRKRLDARFARSSSTLRSAYPKLTNPLPDEPEPPFEIGSQMTITPILDWPIPPGKRREYQTRPPAPHVVRLNEKQDIVWDRSAVYRMWQVPGSAPEFRRIHQAEGVDDAVVLVRTDGQNLWVANAENRILVMSPEGEVFASFDRNGGLPSYSVPTAFYLPENRSDLPSGEPLRHHRPSTDWCAMITDHMPGKSYCLALFSLGAGQCLACGRFGATPETWIAILSYDAATGKTRTDMLHTAARRYPIGNASGLALPENLDITFSVPWACLWENPDDPEERVVILGRRHDCRIDVEYLPNMPLAVDLKTRTVMTLAQRSPNLALVRGGVAAACVDASLLIVDSDRTVLWHRQRDGSYERVDVAEGPTQDYFLLRIGNRVILPGTKWLSLDIGDEIVTTTLAEETNPDHAKMNRYAESACYGIWADADNGSTRYQIRPEEASRTQFSPFSRFVPPQELEEHDRAVAAIRDLGGHVGRFKNCRFGEEIFFPRLRGGDATAVCLTEAWQGGDEGLAYLNRLSQLKVLFLIGADVSEKGFSTIATIKSLEAIALVDVLLSPQRLRPLMDSSSLQVFFLDPGPTASGSSDNCLALLAGNRRLRELALCGPSFTDVSIEHVRKMKYLQMLSLFGTSISPQSRQGLRRGLFVYPRIAPTP